MTKVFFANLQKFSYLTSTHLEGQGVNYEAVLPSDYLSYYMILNFSE